jgi:hypothetical protein
MILVSYEDKKLRIIEFSVDLWEDLQGALSSWNCILDQCEGYRVVPVVQL